MGLLVLTLPTITREPRVARPAANRWLGFGALFSLALQPALTLLSLVFVFSYGPLEAEARCIYLDKYIALWSIPRVESLFEIIAQRNRCAIRRR
jgi:hypothetical protein